jgi:hypothetical protein
MDIRAVLFEYAEQFGAAFAIDGELSSNICGIFYLQSFRRGPALLLCGTKRASISKNGYFMRCTAFRFSAEVDITNHAKGARLVFAHCAGTEN